MSFAHQNDKTLKVVTYRSSPTQTVYHINLVYRLQNHLTITYFEGCQAHPQISLAAHYSKGKGKVNVDLYSALS